MDNCEKSNYLFEETNDICYGTSDTYLKHNSALNSIHAMMMFNHIKKLIKEAYDVQEEEV